MAARKTPAAAAPSDSNGSLTRTIGPFAPLAVAMLAGSLLTSNTPTTAADTTQPAVQATASASAYAPTPLLSAGKPVTWFFVFKFNAGSFANCAGGAQRSCPFGGTVQSYEKDHGEFSQQFAYASDVDPTLQEGGGCVGDTTSDPVGATFDEVYSGHLFYVVWNDQFEGHPIADKSAPAGHSKGVLAWDENGNGLVLQVSTPSWPGSGSAHSPRQGDGNTLGCVNDNDVLLSQHFFALKLNKDDVVQVLTALKNSSVVTDPSKPDLVNNGGPSDIQALAASIGKVSESTTVTKVALSSNVLLLSKPSDLKVPPWQMVSALLGGEPLRVASFWDKPKIPSTSGDATPACWDQSLAKPGAVDIATSGIWSGTKIGFEGLPGPEGNHAKVGVSTGTHSYVILGDMNQQGSLAGDCGSSQNGRGGLFYVVDNPQLTNSMRDLLKGDSAPAN